MLSDCLAPQGRLELGYKTSQLVSREKGVQITHSCYYPFTCPFKIPLHKGGNCGGYCRLYGDTADKPTTTERSSSPNVEGRL